MEKINFNDEQYNGGGNSSSERKTVTPGVDVFTVAEAEVKENTNGKQFLSLKFVNADGKYLKEQFYTTTVNALKRVKELATNAAVTLGEETMDQVATKLIGSKVGLVVGGDKEMANFDGKDTVVTRARIKRAYNFSFKPNELEQWKDSKIDIEDKTAPLAPANADLVANSDDLPF